MTKRITLHLTPYEASVVRAVLAIRCTALVRVLRKLDAAQRKKGSHEQRRSKEARARGGGRAA
jgi:hypothetical protein